MILKRLEIYPRANRSPCASTANLARDRSAPDVLHLPRGRPMEHRAAGGGVRRIRGVVWVPRRVFQRLLPERPTPQRCVEAYYLQRTRFESIAERKLRRRQLTEDVDVEISGWDFR